MSGKNYVFTDKKISGISTIIEYIEKNNLDELNKYANEKSKIISDGTWIFISVYINGKAKTYLVPQFEIK